MMGAVIIHFQVLWLKLIYLFDHIAFPRVANDKVHREFLYTADTA